MNCETTTNQSGCLISIKLKIPPAITIAATTATTTASIRFPIVQKYISGRCRRIRGFQSALSCDICGKPVFFRITITNDRKEESEQKKERADSKYCDEISSYRKVSRAH